MMRVIRALACALVVAAPVARAQESGLPVGTVAPSAMLETLDGKTVDLAKLAAGPSVIQFWATWCENCEALLPAMKKAQAAHGKRVKFIMVAVSMNQSVNRVKLHVAKHKVPGVHVYDTRGNATGSWDVPATSHVVVLDRKGKVVYTGVGGDQNIEAAIRKAL